MGARPAAAIAPHHARIRVMWLPSSSPWAKNGHFSDGVSEQVRKFRLGLSGARRGFVAREIHGFPGGGPAGGACVRTALHSAVIPHGETAG